MSIAYLPKLLYLIFFFQRCPEGIEGHAGSKDEDLTVVEISDAEESVNVMLDELLTETSRRST